MSATFNWVISTLERDLQPADMDGAVIVAHWRCNASQDDYSATHYGPAGFTPDPSSPSYVDYNSISEELALSWCFDNGVDKDAIEASLAANLDLQQNPTQAFGVPWT